MADLATVGEAPCQGISVHLHQNRRGIHKDGRSLFGSRDCRSARTSFGRVPAAGARCYEVQMSIPGVFKVSFKIAQYNIGDRPRTSPVIVPGHSRDPAHGQTEPRWTFGLLIRIHQQDFVPARHAERQVDDIQRLCLPEPRLVIGSALQLERRTELVLKARKDSAAEI
jgi:hypothetical protein